MKYEKFELVAIYEGKEYRTGDTMKIIDSGRNHPVPIWIVPRGIQYEKTNKDTGEVTVSIGGETRRFYSNWDYEKVLVCPVVCEVAE